MDYGEGRARCQVAKGAKLGANEDTLALALVVLAGFLGDGCSSPNRPSLEQGCSEFANIQSIRKTACYGAPQAPDEATSISRAVKVCQLDSNAPGSLVGADYWSGCASAANNDCVGFQCLTYPRGTRQVGEPCLVSNQCATLWCKGTTVAASDGSASVDGIQCGECSTRLPDGSPCDVAADACDVDSSCFQGFCRAKGQDGAPCLHWSDCALPWVCWGNGTCALSLAIGETCSSSLDCTSYVGCDPTTKLCVAIQYGPPGSACDGEVLRCESGSCNRAVGTCPAVLDDAASCDPTDSSTVCKAGASCFQGICQIADPATCR
jgi:hypothetical protein